MLSLSSAAVLVKNSLVDTGSWVLFLTLESPIDGTVIRICSNTKDISRDGVIYAAFPFELDEITEASSGSLPLLTLRVSNVNRLVQSYIEQDVNLGSGWLVTLEVIHTSDSQNYLIYSGTFDNAVWTNSGCTLYTEESAAFRDPFGLMNTYELISDNVGVADDSINQELLNVTEVLTSSVYVKKVPTELDSEFMLSIRSNDILHYRVLFVFTAGIPSVVSTLNGSGTITIEAVDNNWYRISIRPSLWTSGNNFKFQISPRNETVGGTRILISSAQTATAILPYSGTETVAITEGIISEPDLTTEFKSLSVNADEEWVSFQLGLANPLRIQIPRTKYLANSCQHTYKQGGCPYAGTLPTCLKTIQDCDNHFPGDAVLPFLGFPSIIRARVYTS